MTKLRKFSVSKELSGTSLVEFLAVSLGISKKSAKRLVDSRQVFVNKRRTWMGKHELAKGDSVEAPEAAPDARESELEILFKSANYIVVNKPPGLLSDGENSAESILRSKFSGSFLRAVHRLDKDTSGCLLFARSSESRERAIAAFEAHQVRKTYLALALSEGAKIPNECRAPIDGKSALTRFRVLAASNKALLIEASPETGRMHQIRLHLRESHASIVGDSQYGKHTLTSRALRAIQRQMLHAWRLTIPSLALKCEAPPPSDFISATQMLGLRLDSRLEG